MKNCTIATPNGRRVLLRNVSLKVNPTEAFLIVGPSGVGKTELAKQLSLCVFGNENSFLLDIPFNYGHENRKFYRK